MHSYYLQQNKNVLARMGKLNYAFFIIMQEIKTQLPIPLSQIKQSFKIPILKLKPTPQFTQNFYQAITTFGDMCLIIESFTRAIQGLNQEEWVSQRNQILHNNPKCFPLIFEQHVILKTNFIICLTLIEDCASLYQKINEGRQVKMLYFTKLVKSLSLLQERKLSLSSKIQTRSLLFLNNSEQICLDFTKINNPHESQNHGSVQFLQNLLIFMKRLLVDQYESPDQIHQIIFIQGKIYTFEPSTLDQASDYTQLLIFMNACLDLEVNLIHRMAKNASIQKQIGNPEEKQKALQNLSKIRKVKIRNLEGNPLIEIEGKKYSKLNFEDGKCINCLRQVFLKQLSTKFIHQNSLYKLQQFEHLVVRIFKNFGGSRKQQIITVYPPVSKVELISFLIAYIKCVDPQMKSIQFLPFENTLKLIYINRRKQEIVLLMVFYEEYVVKDQQISMILEKSNLLQCKLDLREMKISDSFLIFLSHNEKAKHIKQLHLTDSFGLSDIGLSTFLKSSNSQNLRCLSLSAVNPQNFLLQESLEAISSKQSLNKLFLKKFSKNSSIFSEEIDFSKLSLIQLECIGLKISLSTAIKSALKILKIDQLVPIQDLKHLKHLRLVQLRIRLVQTGKKTLIESFSSFSSLASNFSANKNKQIQIFAEGQSRDSLKKLDISGSNCKYKTIKPLLLMGQLQQINLSGCINLGTEFEPISPKILMVSLANTDLNLQQIAAILKGNQEIVELNIMNTKMGKYDIIKLISPTKMYINNLILSETQYTNKLLELSNGYELIQCIQLYIDRLLEPQQEYSLNLLISKASTNSKTLRFILSLDEGSNREEIQEKKQLLISKINKFLIMTSTTFESLQNLYTNKMRITEILEIQENFQVEDSCQSTVASSIAISTDRCRIVSSPKILIRRDSDAPVLFRVLQRQTIDKFTHRFVKFMRENEVPVSVDLNGNKLIGKDVVNVLREYGNNLVREIDMRNCMFQLNDVIDTIFKLESLCFLNNGDVSIELTKQNFTQRSQQYLKFFMRIKQIRRLKVKCEQIEQLQILFSVLSHVLDQCSSTMNSLAVQLTQIALNKESYHFLNTMFRESELTQLDFRLTQCQILDSKCSYIWYKGVGQLKHLQKLVLYLPAFDFPLLTLSNLIDVELEFTDGEADEGHVNKCLRNLSNSKNLRNLRLSFANCSRISNLNRVFGSLPVGNLFQRLPNLSHLTLNFEYCPLKQPALYELLGYLIRLQQLKMLELNVSFAISQFADFVNCIEKLADELTKPMGIKIICVTENSNTYLLRSENLSQKGILFIL